MGGGDNAIGGIARSGIVRHLGVKQARGGAIGELVVASDILGERLGEVAVERGLEGGDVY
jgi:hypothetical protein